MLLRYEFRVDQAFKFLDGLLKFFIGQVIHQFEILVVFFVAVDINFAGAQRIERDVVFAVYIKYADDAALFFFAVVILQRDDIVFFVSVSFFIFCHYIISFRYLFL